MMRRYRSLLRAIQRGMVGSGHHATGAQRSTAALSLAVNALEASHQARNAAKPFGHRARRSQCSPVWPAQWQVLRLASAPAGQVAGVSSIAQQVSGEGHCLVGTQLRAKPRLLWFLAA